MGYIKIMTVHRKHNFTVTFCQSNNEQTFQSILYVDQKCIHMQYQWGNWFSLFYHNSFSPLSFIILWKTVFFYQGFAKDFFCSNLFFGNLWRNINFYKTALGALKCHYISLLEYCLSLLNYIEIFNYNTTSHFYFQNTLF